MSIFKRILKRSEDSDDTPEAFREMKWGLASPLMLRLAGGIASIRAFGAFSCRVTDAGKLRKEGCDIEDENSVALFKPYLANLLVSSFKDVLGRESSSMSMEELISGVDKLSQAVKEEAAPLFSEKGLELLGVLVMRVVKI